MDSNLGLTTALHTLSDGTCRVHLSGPALGERRAAFTPSHTSEARAAAFLLTAPNPAVMLRVCFGPSLITFSSAERSWVLPFYAQEEIFAPPSPQSALVGHIVAVCWEWRWM
jgi:hypothetical protein